MLSAKLLNHSRGCVTRRSRNWTLAVALAVPLFGAAGCQTPGRLVSSKTSQVCPECETETRTFSLEGLTYDKHICPTCRTEERGGDYPETVHYCRKCRAIVEPCPLCREER